MKRKTSKDKQVDKPKDDLAEETQSVRLDKLLQAVVEKTVAAIANTPEQKAEWWETLGQLENEMEEQGIWEMAIFLDLVRELLEGGDPDRLAILVPPDFEAAWQVILNRRS